MAVHPQSRDMMAMPTDTYATDPHASFLAADEKLGVYIGQENSPAVAWTLRRRRPHAGVYVLTDSTTEGQTDPSQLAKLWFNRDDRFTEDLTLHFTFTPGQYLTTADFTAVAKIPDGAGGFSDVPIDLASGTLTIPGYPAADYVSGIEVDITANDDTTPEWTEDFSIRLDDDPTYVADHPHDTDGYDADGVLGDVDPDAAVLLKDNDLSFGLKQGELVANYNDTNNDNITDYREWGAAGGDGGEDPDLYPMQLNVPRIDKPGASVTLYIPADFFNVYTANTKGQPLTPDVPGGSNYTWNGNASQIPQILWLEVKRGSDVVDDVITAIGSNDNGDEQNFDQTNTAINFKIIADSDPNLEGVTEITNRHRKWLVGQVVDQHVEIECPPAWKTNATYFWIVPGNVLRDYIRTDARGERVALTDDEFGATGQHKGRTQSAIDFYWETSSAGVDTKTISLDVDGINGGETFRVENTYEVQRPTVIDSYFQGTEGFDQNPNPQEIGIYNAPGIQPDGMLFNSSITMPQGFAAGQWNFLQLWNEDRNVVHKVRGSIIPPDDGLWGADNEARYPSNFPNDPYTAWDATSWPAEAVGTTHKVLDTPGQGLAGTSYASINDQFIMYVMFRPPGAGAKWVPLRSLYWAFAVNATDLAPWQLGGAHYHSAGGWKNEAESPVWNLRHLNGLTDWVAG